MIIQLSEFEIFIDPLILERGHKYFIDGAVTQFTETTNGAYEAIVKGSESYNVTLKTKYNAVVESQCTCPYDFSPVCKHITAAIYKLKNELA